MRKRTCILVVFLFILQSQPAVSGTNENNSRTASIPEMIEIAASIHEPPPAWAVMQRQLIRVMEEAAPFYMQRFFRRGGTPYGEGPYDDVYEMFYNWPLFYAIGADEKILDWAVEGFNAITRHCTVYDPKKKDYHHQLYKEFPEYDDWFHISEGMMAFYDFGVANPTIPENIERARRFAGFYMGEDPEAANYDQENKVIRGAFTGSKGPDFNTTVERIKHNLDPQYGWSSIYPVIKKLEEGWDKNPERAREVQQLYNEAVMKGDNAVNLAAAGLVTHAFLNTGDEKYRTWVLEYVDAWMRRIKENGGIIPDNTDLKGKIGGGRDGQWWGGFFGWTSRYSIHMIYGALSVAMESALMLSGDAEYIDLLRSQIDVLLEEAKITKEGQLLVPYNYGPDGWTSFRPMIIRDMAHLWHASMASEDMERIQKVRGGSKFYPLPYSRLYLKENWKAEEPFGWNFVPSKGDRDDNNPLEYPRLQYYTGENPDWPLKILKADYREVVRRVNFMRSDTRDIYSITGDALYQNNPVITKGLQQVTMGAPQSIYNGGLLRARVRYFDQDRMRPGMPEDVAALVEELETERTVIRLVNLSSMHTRNLIVQAGAFGEHRFTNVKYRERQRDNKRSGKAFDRIVLVNDKYFAVRLPPGTLIRLDIGTKRFVNKPGYAFPWHGDSVPVK